MNQTINHILALMSLLLFSISCTKSDLIDGPPAEIRVKNVSPFTFEEVKIWDVDLTTLQSNELSDYFTKEPAFDKATILVRIDTFQFGQTIIDYVGEKPLKRGKYTFEIDISELSNYGFLTQNLVKDN